jgi:chromosomal replication initiator protein
MSGSTIWDLVLEHIEGKVGRHSFHTWFKPTSLLEDDGARISVCVPNLLFTEWLPKHYSVVVAEALREAGRPDCTVLFVPETEGASAGSAALTSIHPPVQVVPAPLVEATPPSPAGEPSRADQLPLPTPPGGLNPRYSFDTFIVGASNQFAHAACRAVAEAPSRSYNPLFIYGGVGLGKTHLMHAIGQYVLQHNRGIRLTYISSERFMNEMINAVRYDRILDFRERYRSVDVLLVDDIQFVSGKEGTQNEFFHTFNALHDAQKQIVISSDRPPHEIPALEERLRSRFEWGLIADIQPPDLETRLAILRSKAERGGRQIPDEILEAIAQRMQSNIRELEGALNRIVAYADLRGIPLTAELVDSALADLMPKHRDLEPQRILQMVADAFNITVDQILARNRTRQVALPRQIAMYLLREEAQISLPQIGEVLGGRDHTTVMYGCDKVADLLEQDDRLRRQVVDIRDQLYGHPSRALA